MEWKRDFTSLTDISVVHNKVLLGTSVLTHVSEQNLEDFEWQEERNQDKGPRDLVAYGNSLGLLVVPSKLLQVCTGL